MVAYTIAMSMALIFAQKHNYEVDSNQELFAQVLYLKLLLLYESKNKLTSNQTSAVLHEFSVATLNNSFFFYL